MRGCNTVVKALYKPPLWPTACSHTSVKAQPVGVCLVSDSTHLHSNSESTHCLQEQGIRPQEKKIK